MYPKKILNLSEQIQSYVDAGMEISSHQEAEEALTSIGYYRLKGYCSHKYNKKTKTYHKGTTFADILALYHFDTELSHLLFRMTSSIKVALRVRLSEALLKYNDALILYDPSIFKDKGHYWGNMGKVSSEIARSKDKFIEHNYNNYHGAIPMWAAVEVMSFGTLSKVITNLKTGKDSAYPELAKYYRHTTADGKERSPGSDMLNSWIQTVVLIRNMCAHNGRIYNRPIKVTPQILNIDRTAENPRFSGLYQAVLAMKYLRPNNKIWSTFVVDFKKLLTKYESVVELQKMNFPEDWEQHLSISEE